MLRDECRVMQLLLLGRLDTRIETGAPAVKDWVETHVLQLAAQRGILFKPCKGIGSEQNEAAARTEASSWRQHEGALIECPGSEVKRRLPLTPHAGHIPGGQDLT